MAGELQCKSASASKQYPSARLLTLARERGRTRHLSNETLMKSINARSGAGTSRRPG